MSWNLRPALSALLRNRTGPVLGALQIAIALAVLVNAVYIVHQRIEKMNRPSGIDEQDLFQIQSEGFTSRYNQIAAMREDLAYLRSLPGVVDAAPAATVPMGWSNQSRPVYLTPGAKTPALVVSAYSMGDHGLKTLGAHLVAGRNFRPDEIPPPPDQRDTRSPFGPGSDAFPEVVVSESVARALFPHESALGRVFYSSTTSSTTRMPTTIIGVMNDVIATSWASSHFGTYDTMLVPRVSLYGQLVRTLPGQRDRLMRVAEDHLATSNQNRVIDFVLPIEYFKRELYREDRNMAIFLVTVTALVVTVACLGIFGLATYNVNTRTKQIGTRRAVGARRGDIIRYFMVENGAITTAGVVVGCVLALFVGYWLSVHYQLPRLDLYYLVGGILALWGIGQLAAWQPARRAASVPPSVATRTV
jgi:putative ABC transport system permease protein